MDRRRRSRRGVVACVLGVALCGAAPLGTSSAVAAPVVYDFAGTGELCRYRGPEFGQELVCTPQDFTGTLALEVNPAGPGRAEIGDTRIDSRDGWVTSTFTFSWDGGSFAPRPVAEDGNFERHSARVSNGYDLGGGRLLDELFVEHAHFAVFGGVLELWSEASFLRSAVDVDWLQDLSFPLDRLLAPGENLMRFAEATAFYNYDLSRVEYSGFTGEFTVASLTARAIAVPEPGTAMLCAIAFAVTSAAMLPRRRRRSAGSGVG
jgi:hypothetical protein